LLLLEFAVGDKEFSEHNDGLIGTARLTIGSFKVLQDVLGVSLYIHLVLFYYSYRRKYQDQPTKKYSW
jgi:hypothetical protein